MTKERKLAKELLSAVWDEDAHRVEELIQAGFSMVTRFCSMLFSHGILMWSTH